MTRSSRISNLLALEEAREREEARRLADAQRLRNERRFKLTELEGYLGDYQRQFESSSRTGTAAAQMRVNHAFIDRLRGVIDQQRQAVTEAEQAVGTRRSEWLQSKQRVDVLRKTIERLDLEQAERERKKEQALTDEAAQRTFKPH